MLEDNFGSDSEKTEARASGSSLWLYTSAAIQIIGDGEMVREVMLRRIEPKVAILLSSDLSPRGARTFFSGDQPPVALVMDEQ